MVAVGQTFTPVSRLTGRFNPSTVIPVAERLPAFALRPPFGTEHVGQLPEDEDPLADMACADFSRREYAPRRSITCFFQIAEDCGQSQRHMPLDILKETQPGAEHGQGGEDVGPEVAQVIGSEAQAGGAEGLAGVAGHEDVHPVAKSAEWEGFNIRPDRCRVQVSRFHFRNQVGAGVGFDLTKSERAQIWDDSGKSEMNSSVAGAPFETGKRFLGMIHIILLV